MKDSLEKRVSEFGAGLLVKAASKLAKYWWRMETPGMAEYFSAAGRREKAAVFVMKHHHMADYIASLYPFLQAAKKQPMIPVKKSLFRYVPLAAFLKKAGAVPITRPNDKGYEPNSAEALKRNKEMIKHLLKGGWYAYCPEGTRKLGKVGLIDDEYLKPILLAARLGVDVYVVGVEYIRALPISPWVPFLTKIVVRFEKYDPSGKTAEQVTLEVREAIARLSGLEGKLEIGQPRAAASGTPIGSTAGYN